MSENNKQQIKQQSVYGSYRKKLIGGLCCLALFFLTWLIATHFYCDEPTIKQRLLVAKNILLVLGIFLIIPYEWLPYIFFDNREYDKNETLDELVEKIRFRAVLFNNISILVFVFTIIVIIAGFWLLAAPQQTDKELTEIANRVTASVMLLFLIQMLFRLFKYLLRVAAFYNGKADALEFSRINPKTPINMTIDYFTPDKYDIADIQDAVPATIVDAVKTKPKA